jgi:predicted HD superfamily hydrolase involved in NAD metabolism
MNRYRENMHPILSRLVRDFTPLGDLSSDVPRFLMQHKCPKTAEHSRRVAAAARFLAEHYHANPFQAEQAGWLHDISAVIPWLDRAHIAYELGIEVLPEENEFPPIIHQKLSAVIGREIFGIRDDAVLSAVECHSTLKSPASLMDKVVFVADKIEWDGEGRPPYLDDLLNELKISLDHAALTYLDYLIRQRETLPVLHPWTAASHRELTYTLIR